jgi:hypothetical protein
MMFDVEHHHKAYKKLLPYWFGPFVIGNVFVNNIFYKLKNVNDSPYPDHVDREQLKKF